MAAGPVWQLTITGDIDGQRVQNVLHFRETAAGAGEIPALDLIEAVGLTVMPKWAACLSAGWQATSFYCRKVAPVPAIPFLRLATGTMAFIGTRGDAVCPPTSALLLSLYSDEASRRGRGRIYLPGVAEADQDAGQIVEALLTAAVVLCEELDDTITDANGGQYNPCVFSRVDVEGYDVITAQPQTNLATQRSRRAYPGMI
jgi:hypothetical protein